MKNKLPRLLEFYLWIAALALGTGLIVFGNHRVNLAKRQTASVNTNSAGQAEFLQKLFSK